MPLAPSPIIALPAGHSPVLVISQNSASVTIHANGKVEITPGVTMDDAARLFWQAVEKNFPHAEAVKAERERCAAIAYDCEEDNHGEISRIIGERIEAGK